jgi:hypothetical protein
MRTFIAKPLAALVLSLGLPGQRESAPPGFDVTETFECGPLSANLGAHHGRVQVIHETTTQDATWSQTTVELRVYGEQAGAVALSEEAFARLEAAVREALAKEREWALTARTHTTYEHRDPSGLVFGTFVDQGQRSSSYVDVAPGVRADVDLEDLAASLASARARLLELR